MNRATLPVTLLLTVLLSGAAWAVPVRGPLTAAPPQTAPSYRVKKGDSLYAIARRNGLSVAQLKALNGLKSDALQPGQRLRLGAGMAAGGDKRAAAPPTAAAKAAAATATYRVKKGDSLYAIARRNGLSVAQLKTLNGLKGDALQPGQRLQLGPAAAAATAALLTGPDPAELLRKEAAAAKAEPPALVDSTPETLEEVAYTYLSTPYRFGGSSRRGIDCSSFVQQVFREIDIPLPRTAREQYRVGADVATGELQSGDLLFFRTYAKYPSHVGIYLGGQKMIHASPRSRRVVIANIDTPYFRSRFIGAKRPALLAAPLDLEALTRDVEEEPEPEAEEVSGPAPATPDN